VKKYGIFQNTNVLGSKTLVFGTKTPVPSIPHTVKLGYNDHGYNEFTAITNEIY